MTRQSLTPSIAVVVLAVLSIVLPGLAPSAIADKGYPYDGMVVIDTDMRYEALTAALKESVKSNKMGLVTQASATLGAASLGKTIPGNMVVGVYRPDFAIRMLEASVPAGIEAPLRFYVTEQANGTATLTYRRPSAVFAPYDNAALDEITQELDAIFDTIAEGATSG